MRGLGTSLTSLACMIMPENVPIMLALCSMLARPYYAPNYAGIIRPSLAWVAGHETNLCSSHARGFICAYVLCLGNFGRALHIESLERFRGQQYFIVRNSAAVHPFAVDRSLSHPIREVQLQ